MSFQLHDHALTMQDSMSEFRYMSGFKGKVKTDISRWCAKYATIPEVGCLKDMSVLRFGLYPDTDVNSDMLAQMSELRHQCLILLLHLCPCTNG